MRSERPSMSCWGKSCSNSPVRRSPQNPRARHMAKLMSAFSNALDTRAAAKESGSGGACFGRSTRLHNLKSLHDLSKVPLHHGAKWCSPDKVSAIVETPAPAAYSPSIQSLTISSKSLGWSSRRGRTRRTPWKYLSRVFSWMPLSSSVMPRRWRCLLLLSLALSWALICRVVTAVDVGNVKVSAGCQKEAVDAAHHWLHELTTGSTFGEYWLANIWIS